MRLQPGEACRGSRMCSVGQGVMATCEATAGGAMCGERAILHPAGVGERCGRITADGRYTPCRGGVCRTNDQLNEIGNCVAFRPEGTTCNGEGGPCVPGTWCPLSQAGGSTCERMSFTRNVGTSCDMETSNVFCDLEAGLYCASDKTCQRLGDGSAGSLCSEPWSRIHQSCNEGLFCSESSTSSESTCRARVPAGSPCGSDEECESGQCPYNVVTGQGECAHDYCDPWGAP